MTDILPDLPRYQFRSDDQDRLRLICAACLSNSDPWHEDAGGSSKQAVKAGYRLVAPWGWLCPDCWGHAIHTETLPVEGSIEVVNR